MNLNIQRSWKILIISPKEHQVNMKEVLIFHGAVVENEQLCQPGERSFAARNLNSFDRISVTVNLLCLTWLGNPKDRFSYGNAPIHYQHTYLSSLKQSGSKCLSQTIFSF